MEVFGIKLSEYGAPALCALFIIMIFLGLWVPRRDRDQWRQSALRSADQVDKLTESIEPMLVFIRALKEKAAIEEERRSRAPDRDGGDG